LLCCVRRPARFADCQSDVPARCPFGAIAGPFPFLGSRRVPQQEILDHKFAFAPRKWAATGAARCLTVDGFRTGFDFDDLIKRIAFRTVEIGLPVVINPPHRFLIIGAKLPFPVVHSQSESASATQMKYVVIGFVLVFVPGVLVA
jgi:hypothetical protein